MHRWRLFPDLVTYMVENPGKVVISSLLHKAWFQSIQPEMINEDSAKPKYRKSGNVQG